jgi:hypothetical protein
MLHAYLYSYIIVVERTPPYKVNNHKKYIDHVDSNWYIAFNNL